VSKGLYFRGLTPDQLAVQLDTASASTRREAKKALREGAKQIMGTSVQQCAIDEGNLEEAHELTIVRLSQDNMEVEIEVGGVVNGVDVDDYAWMVHETQAPYGDMPLGPKSQAKNAGNPADRFVGGKFLERAADEHEDDILNSVADILLGDIR
jgi:hypothetical protein